MEEAQKFFTCAVGGCSLRFTSTDSLMMHQKKHDMVLNIGTGQKTNVFMADQTPTPTRFIRNCEEVGLFQDLQNVNPFEETFRKAVEASREGGSHLEVQSLHIPTATDDTLHTPHVFPNITEDHSSITNLISSTTVIQTSSVEKSQSREVLDTLQVPTILHTEPAVIEVAETNDLDTDIQIEYRGNTAVLVKQEEAETSQNNPSRASSVDSGCKISASTVSPRDTVQVVFQMPDGRLVQLSGVSMDSIPSTQLPVQVPPTVVHTAPSPQPSIAPSPMVINTQFVQTTSQVAQQVSTVAQQTTVSQPTSISPPSVGSSDDTTNNLQTRLSVAKMKLKQRIQFNTKRKLTPARDMETIQSSSKMGTAQQPFLDMPSESDINSSVSPKGKRLLISTHEVDEQRLKFRERNRAAAMRCREKRKHWILELEKRADETQRVNQQLSAEVTKLRSELVHLKTLLLAHRDCSVTRAMQQGAGIGIARSASTVKTSTMAQLQVQQSTVTIPRLPVSVPGTVNVCASPEETQPKVVLLSKPAGLKRRRQAALAALAVIENGPSSTKDSHVDIPQTAHVVTVAQPMSISPTVSESLQITNNHPAELKSSLITDSVTTTPQTCLITVTAPTLISTGVPTQGIAIKSGSLTSTSYLMPTKLCLPTTDSTIPQLIKLNSNILKTGVSEAVKTNNMTHSNGDSMDSGHGSDIEILAEIPNKTEEKS